MASAEQEEQATALTRDPGRHPALRDADCLAAMKGGYCISESNPPDGELRWRCDGNHRWTASFEIAERHWCARCANRGTVGGATERECRILFETLLGEEFPKTHPEFLRFPKTGRLLQLDGYCAKRCVGFEYQGAQHYKESGFFHAGDKTLQAQKERDEFKVEACRQNKVALIVIPFTVEHLRDYIKAQLIVHGFHEVIDK